MVASYDNSTTVSTVRLIFVFFQDKLSIVLSCSEISTLPFWPELAPVFGKYFRPPVFA